MGRLTVLVLGSAAGGGFPQWNCRCATCRLAWAGDTRVRPRTQASLAVTADSKDGYFAAAGAGAITFGALAIIAVLQHRPGAGLMPAILAGALTGFLFYNLFPARLFMGDTGSLALGTAMVAAAITTGFLWYLPLLALVFVIETVSVIAQVASFKMTGKRIIRMSPLHNHFIVSGWRETPLALWFWAGSLVAALLAVALARPGPAS